MRLNPRCVAMDDETRRKHRLEFRETFAKTGHETLRALLIVSGGAAVAYLTFLGTMFGDPAWTGTFGATAAGTLIGAMRYYILSVACALLCYGFTWLSHGCYYFDMPRSGHAAMALAVLAGLVCFGLFVVGSLQAATAFGQAAGHISA